jgi:hypothetical protein
MSLVQKSALGPGRVVRCQACGKPVTAHVLGMLSAVPAFLGGYYALQSGSLLTGAAAMIAGVAAMALIQIFVVPLVRP